jgi:hypothetical protein
MSLTPDDPPVAIVEKRLAVVTNWSLFASFGMCFILSGFNGPSWGMGLLGYALLVLGFVGHLIINHVFETGFSAGEVALGLVLFGISALSFIASALFSARFGPENLGLGLAGLGALASCLVFYLVIRYGMRGTWVLIHTLRHRGKGTSR